MTSFNRYLTVTQTGTILVDKNNVAHVYPHDLVRDYDTFETAIRDGKMWDPRGIPRVPAGWNDWAENYTRDTRCPFKFTPFDFEKRVPCLVVGPHVPLDHITAPRSSRSRFADAWDEERRRVGDRAVYQIAALKQRQDDRAREAYEEREDRREYKRRRLPNDISDLDLGKHTDQRYEAVKENEDVSGAKGEAKKAKRAKTAKKNSRKAGGAPTTPAASSSHVATRSLTNGTHATAIDDEELIEYESQPGDKTLPEVSSTPLANGTNTMDTA